MERARENQLERDRARLLDGKGYRRFAKRAAGLSGRLGRGGRDRERKRGNQMIIRIHPRPKNPPDRVQRPLRRLEPDRNPMLS